jgi:hypothetical protein
MAVAVVVQTARLDEMPSFLVREERQGKWMILKFRKEVHDIETEFCSHRQYGVVISSVSLADGRREIG